MHGGAAREPNVEGLHKPWIQKFYNNKIFHF